MEQPLDRISHRDIPEQPLVAVPATLHHGPGVPALPLHVARASRSRGLQGRIGGASGVLVSWHERWRGGRRSVWRRGALQDGLVERHWVPSEVAALAGAGGRGGGRGRVVW